VFGRRSLETASALNSLGVLYKSFGRLASATRVYRRALAIFGGHPEEGAGVASRRRGDCVALAALLDGVRKFAEAERLYRHAFGVFRRKLGAQHLEVAVTLNNLAALFATRGRFAEALPLFDRALADLRRRLSPRHPSVVACGRNRRLVRERLGAFPGRGAAPASHAGGAFVALLKG
jgi:Flp pilus assembly protein TadD